MVLDRDYMKDPFAPDESHSMGPSWEMNGNRWLMVLMLGLFFLDRIVDRFSGDSLVEYLNLALEAQPVIEQFQVWRLVSYMFFFGGDALWALLFVFIGLFFFGSMVEDMWGTSRYLQFFLFAGVFAAFLILPLAYFRMEQTRILGATASIMAILVAAAMEFPNMRVLLFFVIPIRLKYMILLFVVVGILGVAVSSPTGVLTAFHNLAGAGFGYLYYRYHTIVERWLQKLETSSEDGRSSYSSEGGGGIREGSDSGVSRGRGRSSGGQGGELDGKVDRILDKISKEGLNALTDEEREVLKEASEKFDDDSRGTFHE